MREKSSELASCTDTVNYFSIQCVIQASFSETENSIPYSTGCKLIKLVVFLVTFHSFTSVCKEFTVMRCSDDTIDPFVTANIPKCKTFQPVYLEKSKTPKHSAQIHSAQILTSFI